MISHTIQKLKFLHIDDFANYRSMLKSILQGIGIADIDNAANATDAIQMIRAKEYDVILCDYNLGDGQNGQQFYEELMHKSLLSYGAIFMMVTAENTKDMVMAAVEFRPDGYLNKPFPKEVLISRLEKLVNKKEAMKSIYMAFNSKDYTKAIQLCDAKMKALPKLALEIGKLKAKVAITAKNYDLAISIYDKALSIRPFDWAKYGKASALFEQENYTEAQEILIELIKTSKDYIEAYDLLAKIYTLNDEYVKAQDILSTATDISPRTVLRQQNLAKTALKTGDTAVAERAFRQTISNSQYSHLDDVSNHTALTKLYIENGDTTKANKLLNKTRQNYKNDKDALFQTQLSKCMLELKQGHKSEAREAFEQVLQKMPRKIHELPEELQKDLIQQSKELGEEDITQAFISDIENPSDSNILSAKQLKRYTFLLMNGKAMRLYKKDKWLESMKLFDEAATNLPDSISINMNAAQAIIMMIKKGKVKSKTEQEECKKKIRCYLDICKSLDPTNEKYQKLETLYNGI